MEPPPNIPLSLPTITGKEESFVKELLKNPSYFKERHYVKKCAAVFKQMFPNSEIFLTNSCTQSLELAALLLDIQPGDEVIMSSFTHTSTANAFVLRGAIPVFVDIRPDTMNIDEKLIEDAITDKTKCIVPMHYSSVGCDMDSIKQLAEKYSLKLVEDAAHAIRASYNGSLLGQFGDIGCISFDYIKNINCGEGGIILINDKQLLSKAEVIYENGTNRADFERGGVKRFVWKATGSKYYPSDLMAAFLYAQLEELDTITANRLKYWNQYFEKLKELESSGKIELPDIPINCGHNAHIFYIKTTDEQQRRELTGFLKGKGISAAFHYIPLNNSDFGRKAGRFAGKDQYTTKESERLLRLPLFHGIREEQINYVVDCVHQFYH